MSLSMRHFETLHWVAKLGSLRAAAEQLGVSQSRVSERMSQLETELGVPLLMRTRQGSSLTRAGQTAADYADRIVSLASDLSGRVVRQERMSGTIRLGMIESTAIVHMSRIIEKLESQHPDLHLSLTIDTSQALGRLLSEGAVDAAVLVPGPLGERWAIERVGGDNPIWVGPPNLVTAERLYTARDIEDMRIVTNFPPSNMHTLIDEWFKLSNSVPAHLNYCNSVATILHLMMAGTCCGILPREMIEEQLAKGMLVEMQTNLSLPVRSVYFCHRRSSTNPALQPLRTAIAEALKGTLLQAINSERAHLPN